MEKMGILEAILFMSPKPLNQRKMMKVVGIHKGYILTEMINKLNKKYEDNDSPLRIFNTKDDYHIMNILPEYANYVQNFNVETELSKSEMKVLGYVAKHDGILKSTLTRKIGPVYDKIKSIEDKGFLKEMAEGRSSKLFLTKKFKEYFGDNF